ncbi:tetratricopeptide repeat protein [candidate division WOR-3 bacterium]|nr:tetratricopeptide repeat protein [candidate division WOR-3 bacterium]
MRFKGKHRVSKQDLKEDQFQKLVERAMEFYYRDRQRVWIGAAAVVAVIIIAILLLQNRGPGVNPQAEMAFTQAIGIYTSGNVSQAEQAFKDVSGRFGREFVGAKARFYLANIYFGSGRTEEAKKEFSGFLARVKKDPLLSPAAQFGLGNCEEQAGDDKAAGRAYEEVKRRWPKSPLVHEAMMAAGRAYRNAGAYDQAEAIYRELLKGKPEGEPGEAVKTELARIETLRKRFQ